MRLNFFIPIALLFSLIPTLSLAEERYTVGRQSCDFEFAENRYNNYDREGAYAHIIGQLTTSLYGSCLVLKGIETHDDASKRQGLALLDWLTDEHSGMNSVSAMFFKAQYIETGGAFNYDVDEGNIDRAIRAYTRVLFFIKLDKGYPSKYSESERRDQMEIVSINMIPSLYHIKFEYGWIGSHNRYLQQSPSYKGDKASLKLYLEPNTDPAVQDPAYSDLRVITDSLSQMISSAQACIALPYKHYHRKNIYDDYRRQCEIFNRLGKTLLALEEKRQEFLINKPCSKDVLQCEGYMAVHKEIDKVLKEMTEKLYETPNPWLQ